MQSGLVCPFLLKESSLEGERKRIMYLLYSQKMETGSNVFPSKEIKFYCFFLWATVSQSLNPCICKDSVHVAVEMVYSLVKQNYTVSN